MYVKNWIFFNTDIPPPPKPPPPQESLQFSMKQEFEDLRVVYVCILFVKR